MYRKFVKRNKLAFGANLKMAEDIAKILDHPLAQVKEGGEGPYDARWTILNGFYVLSWRCGVPHLTFDDIFSCIQKIDLDKNPNCLYPQGTSRPVHVLIVDDSPNDLLSSAYALVGIPNLTVDFYHCDVRRFTVEMQWGEVFQKVCEDIESASKDIVLMDQEFGHVLIKGSKIVEKLKGDNSKLLFVANTAGMSEKLEGAGCLQNFDKGNNFEGISQALEMCT